MPIKSIDFGVERMITPISELGSKPKTNRTRRTASTTLAQRARASSVETSYSSNMGKKPSFRKLQHIAKTSNPQGLNRPQW